MKKFLVFFTVLFGITCNAMAQDYMTNDGFKCATVDDFVKSSGTRTFHEKNFTDSYARIYFDTGKSDFHNGCEQYYKNLAQALEDRADDIDGLVFIGMTDEQGDARGFDNTALAYARGEKVADLLSARFSMDEVIYVSGSEEAKLYSDYIKNGEFRAVDVFVIWKHAGCDAESMQTVENTKMRLESAKLKKSDEEIKEKALTIIGEIQELCKDGNDQLSVDDSKAFGQKYSDLLDLVGQLPGFKGDAIALYYKNINAKIQRSEWKDAKGNFNKARLASDSIAGVVLGTAGGLITSNIVKKNQVKAGFEDIQCTIGGQKVADWHDEFTVGIQ